MLAVGALLLTASGGYYAYAQFVKTGRDDLVHQVPRPTLHATSSSAYANPASRSGIGQPQAIEVASSASEAETVNPETRVVDIQKLPSSKQRRTIQIPIEESNVAPASAARNSTAWSPSAEQISMISGPVDGRVSAAIEELLYLQALRPGYVAKDEPETQADPDLIDPSQGSSPSVRVIQRSQDRNPSTHDHMVATSRDIDYSRAMPTVPEPKYATRIMVPGIGLRAEVEELEVVEEDDSRAWETPKHVVGHIPTTAKPGTSGQGWYFGHLESPISGEGNIFRRLPELAARFKRGEQFTIHLDAGNDRYVYQVYQTDVVHASEFAVFDSGKSDITLVSCWPQFEYSERVLVTAALVDIVEIPESERIQPSSG